MIFLKLGRYFNEVPYSVISGINGVPIELEYYDKALETSSPEVIICSENVLHGFPVIFQIA